MREEEEEVGVFLKQTTTTTASSSKKKLELGIAFFFAFSLLTGSIFLAYLFSLSEPLLRITCRSTTSRLIKPRVKPDINPASATREIEARMKNNFSLSGRSSPPPPSPSPPNRARWPPR